jgi:hypothetical protein
MTEDFHMMSINRLDESVRKLGERTGEAEKKMAVHENECSNRYKEIQTSLADLQKELIERSTKQMMLIQMVGYGLGAMIAAYQTAKVLGLI